MQYLAVTQPSAEWLHGKGGHVAALHDSLFSLVDATSLSRSVLAIGALRICASADSRFLALWNTDYLSNRGEESWGIVRLVKPYGLLDDPTTSLEVFERQLYVINQRLRGLLLDDRCIHRVADGVHSCVAGRGEGWRSRIAYVEKEVETDSSQCKALICIGPAWQDTKFLSAAKHEGAQLTPLVRTANALLAEAVLRPLAETALFSRLTDRFQPASATRGGPEGPAADLPALKEGIGQSDAYKTLDWSYEQWVSPGSKLTEAQRRVLDSNAMESQPVRIIGAAGSGKTLLMMLLAMRRLTMAEKQGQHLRILYIVHNSAMSNSVWNRFLTLGGERFMAAGDQVLQVSTLVEYGRQRLGISEGSIIHADAHETKTFQRNVVADSLREVLDTRADDVAKSHLFSRASHDQNLFAILTALLADEISTSIKGHGLGADRKRYVESEKRLSRLHGVLTQGERELVFDCFERYHRTIFDQLQVLDSDDLSISLLHSLRTPLWEMQRRKIAFDYVFVDETQLFNENERRLFPLLTKVSGTNVPVVLALDEAQQTSGASSPGFGLLGLTGLVDESLFAVHRNTQAIVRLAFFVIQRTTDLFGSDFPDFTGRTDALIKDDHSLAEPPVLITSSEDSPSFGKFILRQIRNLRRKNLRQVAVVCHAEKYWAGISSELQGSDLPIRVLTTRGERIDTRAPIVVLARPEKVARILRRRALRPSPLEIGVRAAGSALPRREDCQRFDQTASE